MKTPLLAALCLATLLLPAAHAAPVTTSDRQYVASLSNVALGPPVAVVGAVRLTLAPNLSVTTIGYGVASPCETYPAEFQCVANPIVQPLYVPSAGLTGPAVVTLYRVTVHVDANGDGFDEASFPGVELA
ncbi:MAG: hypothetical protein QOG31_111 [Thermoplasmata archaeon]|jgi:hypothetical protein|nr:hypothetical protein [Thermoplasmata archaeon]